MSEIGDWDKDLPSNNSDINKGDDLLRSHWSILQEGWEDEHFWTDGSSSSAGVHKPGSSRVSYGSGSAPTTGDEGRTFYDVDHNYYVAQGSSATTAVASAYTISTQTPSGAAGVPGQLWLTVS